MKTSQVSYGFSIMVKLASGIFSLGRTLLTGTHSRPVRRVPNSSGFLLFYILRNRYLRFSNNFLIHAFLYMKDIIFISFSVHILPPSLIVSVIALYSPLVMTYAYDDPWCMVYYSLVSFPIFLCIRESFIVHVTFCFFMHSRFMSNTPFVLCHRIVHCTFSFVLVLYISLLHSNNLYL